MNNKKLETEIIIVDENNNFISTGEKLDIHRKGLLHRAFSLFIYNEKENEVLIQKRAHGKYHSGGLWTNTCCSHPYNNESESEMFKRTFLNELGIIPDFKIKSLKNFEKDSLSRCIYKIGTFQYFSDYGEMKENEIDDVYVYFLKSIDLDNYNREEIAELKWIKTDELKNWLDKHPDEFTSWFPYAFKVFLEFIENYFGD